MSFWKNEDGSVATIFGVALFALLAAMALAVDFARAVSARTSLTNMADTAALAGATNLGVSPSAALTRAYDTFDAQNSKHTSSVTRTMSIGPSGYSVIATATGTVKTYFGQIIGQPEFYVSVQAEAQYRISFLDVFLLLDVSGSMGLPATQIEIDRMKTITTPIVNDPKNAGPQWDWVRLEGNCMFACHIREGFEPAGKTLLDVARASGILLRWDVLSDAAATMAETLLAPPSNTTYGSTVQVAGYSFSDTPQKMFDLTKVPSGIRLQIAKDSNLNNNTDTNGALTQMATVVGTSGDGLSSSTSRKVVVLATDGVRGTRGGSHDPIDTAFCDALKAKGITVAVINVQYIADDTSYYYRAIIKPIYPQIEPALQACASGPSLYIKASDGPAIKTAFTEMAKRLSAQQMRMVN